MTSEPETLVRRYGKARVQNAVHQVLSGVNYNYDEFDWDDVRCLLESTASEMLVPQSSYRAPILLCLLGMDSRAHISAVYDCVENRMKDILSDLDYGERSDGDVIWKNNTRQARRALIEEGLMYSSSPREIWELTPKGRHKAELLQSP